MFHRKTYNEFRWKIGRFSDIKKLFLTETVLFIQIRATLCD